MHTFARLGIEGAVLTSSIVQRTARTIDAYTLAAWSSAHDGSGRCIGIGANGTNPSAPIPDTIRKRLNGVMGGDEEGSEVPEPLKVWPTAFFELVSQVIQVGHTIFDDP